MSTRALMVVVLLLVFKDTWANKRTDIEQNILNEMFSGYDKRFLPNVDSETGRYTGPVDVEVNALLRNLEDLDDPTMNQQYSAQLTYRLKWVDSRLKHDGVGNEIPYITLTGADQIWMPDLFFTNNRNGRVHNLTTPNRFVRIYPDGEILYSARLTLELFCPMNLKFYPMDKQECSIYLSVYGHYSEDVRLLWKQDDPVQLSRDLQHPLTFSLTEVNATDCTVRACIGEYSCLKLSVRLTRKFVMFLRQVYLPSAVMVVMALLALWLPTRSVAFRLVVWISVYLTLVIVAKSVADIAPCVPYMTTLDVWTASCSCFMFCILIEMAFVSSAAVVEDRKKREIAEEASVQIRGNGAVRSKTGRFKNFLVFFLRWFNNYHSRADSINAVSRVLLFAAFVLFNIAYWITCFFQWTLSA